MASPDFDLAAREVIARASGMDVHDVDLDDHLSAYGIDSYVEVEIMLECPAYFGNLDVEHLPYPVTGRDLVNYMKLNSQSFSRD